MPQVEWRSRAIADIERLYTFLRAKDAAAAQKMAYALSHGASLLETSPRIGRPIADTTNRRELLIPFGAGAYVIRYIISDGGTVIVIRVWHSREDRAD